MQPPGGNIDLKLWDGPTPQFLNEPSGERGQTLDERFQKFHEQNGWVYTALVRLARETLAAGRTRCGIKMLFEVLRWQWELATISDDEFRLNNNHTSRYARLIMSREPDLEGFFEIRELKAA